MKPFVEQRLFTMTEQIAVVQLNEMSDGLVLITQEVSSDHNETRLYLTTAEAEELVFMIKSMVHRIKNH